MASPLLGTRAVNAELVAAPLLMLSCALTLFCLRRAGGGGPYLHWAIISGVVGGCAVLVKQNFVDALVFAAVLLVATAARRAPLRPATAVIGGGLAVGGLAVGLAALMWATVSGSGVAEAWYALYGFRSDALRIVVTQSFAAPAERLGILGAFALLSGVVALICLYVALRGRAIRREPVAAAVTAMLAVGLVSVALGGSYWAHYLIGLVPALGLAVADLSASAAPARRWLTGTVAFVVVSAIVSIVMAEVSDLAPTRATDRSLVRWLGDAADDDDSAVIAYGHAHVIQAAGLEPAYPYLWSLQVRTLDPELSALTRHLEGPDPTWVLEWDSFNSWELDAEGRLSATVDEHYRHVTSVCGVDVFLRKGVQRDLPPVPTSCGE